MNEPRSRVQVAKGGDCNYLFILYRVWQTLSDDEEDDDGGYFRNLAPLKNTSIRDRVSPRLLLLLHSKSAAFGLVWSERPSKDHWLCNKLNSIIISTAKFTKNWIMPEILYESFSITFTMTKTTHGLFGPPSRSHSILVVDNKTSGK